MPEPTVAVPTVVVTSLDTGTSLIRRLSRLSGAGLRGACRLTAPKREDGHLTEAWADGKSVRRIMSAPVAVTQSSTVPPPPCLCRLSPLLLLSHKSTPQVPNAPEEQREAENYTRTTVREHVRHC
ncbi:hypothetical protein AAFF_G00107080 [Aldrovandia affinis]|uniref:Uncharacterized protein n=1 Tax=Aldrovandia affinis TaxID=143900 RepID=A0AAD7WXD6_9TELE|nr:hypothetical protein AAFF_G00107080 [Aldrovandia affinis]